MITAPSPTSLAILLGLSFFLGLAFEDFFADAKIKVPGGIRTFPMLALAGGVLYLFDPTHFIPFTAGLVVLGAWLALFYISHARDQDEHGESNFGFIVPLLNVHAYLLGGIALALPHWVAVAITVTAVLLLTGREQLHALARRIEMKEIVTAGEFLILAGIILPLLPSEPVTTLTSITPRQVWLALVVVCTFSYISYLAQHYWAPATRGLWMAALGGLYSSTVTTVVMARQANGTSALARYAEAGITLATAIMYLRILVIITIFNVPLARALAIPMAALSLTGLIICALQYRLAKAPSAVGDAAPTPVQAAAGSNPLEIGPAVIFAALFVATSLVSSWAKSQFGISGIYSVAAIIGVTDIDPFVLNLAQGGVAGVANTALAAAILIAASSNNVLKAFYAISFGGGRATASATATLILLAIAGVALAVAMAMGFI